MSVSLALSIDSKKALGRLLVKQWDNGELLMVLCTFVFYEYVSG